MAIWNGLVDKARSFMGRKPKPTMQSIRRTRMDDLAYQDLLKEVPVLSDIAYDLNEVHAYTGELVSDGFHCFFKGAPELEDVDAMDPRALINRTVIDAVMKLPTTPRTRQYTKYDKYGAAVATSALERKLDEELRKAEEVRDATEQAAQDAEGQEQLEDAAQAAADQLEATNPPEVGPLTENQQALAEQLQQALDAAEAAAGQAQQSRAAAEQAVATLQRQVRGKVAEAVQEAGDYLAEEQALFQSWGIEPGEVSKMSFAERQELANKLSHNRLAAFRKLIGRYRMRAAAERAHKVIYGRDEVYDTTMSDFLPDVIGSEFAKLAHRATRLMFLRDFAEAQLLSRAWRGIEKVGDGALVVILDTSSSMKAKDAAGNTREAFAKAVALSMLDQAHAAKRDFVVINFASAGQQREWRFPAGQQVDIDYLLSWVEHMFNGGTNYDRPIDMAVDIIARDFNDAGKQRADLVILTDDECGVTPQWLRTYQERKKRLGFRTWGVAIGMSPGISLAALCDDVRGVSDFSDPGVMADMHRQI